MEHKSRIKKILKSIKGEWFDEEKNLLTDGYINSFEILMIVKEIEKEFSIKVPIESIELDIFNNIEDICNMINTFEYD